MAIRKLRIYAINGIKKVMNGKIKRAELLSPIFLVKHILQKTIPKYMVIFLDNKICEIIFGSKTILSYRSFLECLI